MVRLLQAYIKKAPGMVTEEHKLVIYTIFIDTCVSVAKTLGMGSGAFLQVGKQIRSSNLGTREKSIPTGKYTSPVYFAKY
jgi:hypothetical protein